MDGIAYSFDKVTGEYLGPVIAQESPLEPGHILRPAYASFEAPPLTKERERAVFAYGATEDRNFLVDNGGTWSVVADWRGIAFYNTETGLPLSIEDIGAVPDDTMTERPRSSVDDSWLKKKGKWEVDAEKRLARMTSEAKMKRDALLSDAVIRIAPLQDAVDLKVATDQEMAMLGQWKLYRVALNRIHQVSGFPSHITWPASPNSAASATQE